MTKIKGLLCPFSVSLPRSGCLLSLPLSLSLSLSLSRSRPLFLVLSFSLPLSLSPLSPPFSERYRRTHTDGAQTHRHAGTYHEVSHYKTSFFRIEEYGHK